MDSAAAGATARHRKIHIIGGPGSGKSFIAARLSRRYGLPAFDLDEIFWDRRAGRYRVRAPAAERDAALGRILRGPGRIIEGVYHGWLSPSFEAADRIVILMPSVWTRDARLVRRFVERKVGAREAGVGGGPLATHPLEPSIRGRPARAGAGRHRAPGWKDGRVRVDGRRARRARECRGPRGPSQGRVVTDEVRVRDARAGDEAAIRDVTLAAYGQYASHMRAHWDGYRRNILDTLAADGPAQRLVAEHAGSIVGSVILYPPGAAGFAADGRPIGEEWPEVRLLAVDPAARGRGVGLLLMQACVDRARAAGATALALHTTDMMGAAMRLYARMGFARAPELDFQPAPGITVKGFLLALDRPARQTL